MTPDLYPCGQCHRPIPEDELHTGLCDDCIHDYRS